MDSTLTHEALARFDAIEQRLVAIEEHLFGDKPTEEEPEPTPEVEPETEEHTEV